MTGLFSDAPAGYARVAVERGVDRYPEGLTYAIPDDLADLAAGERVVVPLGRGNTASPGYVIEVLAATPPPEGLKPDAVKSVKARDRLGTRLPGGLVDLARWIAAYYCAPIGLTLAAMLPAAVKRNTGGVVRTLVTRADPVPDAAPRSAQQRAVLEALDALGPDVGPLEMRELADRAEVRTIGPIRRLLDSGHLTAVKKSAVEAKWAEYARDERIPAALTPAQTRVVDDVGAVLDGGFSGHLLFGVTGSGKTEVYIRLIERTVAAGRVALVLVPEIALTPQTAGRLLGRFPNHRVAMMHSGLTAAQRHQHWTMVADGTADIVIGARSAVFAPIPDGRLGLIVVDEEHDGSYKQDQAPRYHGRDVALRRAQLAQCPILLGSATPACESWFNATERGTFTLHEMPDRAPGLTLPRVLVVDMVEERKLQPRERDMLVGPTLTKALTHTLDAGFQALLLLNRRGYASYITCPDPNCGWVMNCDDCDVTMVYHRKGELPGGGFVRCHHCDAAQRLPGTCPSCSKRLRRLGLGTQRLEEDLERVHPDLERGRTLVRVDSDTMRSSRDLHDVLDRFGAGDVRVLMGTQMIAKGLDFPRVRLVGVINADTAINLPDFRAAERTFQLVSQVAGRCGRGQDEAAAVSRVIVQSFNPETPAIRLAAAHDFRTFAQLELAGRRACGLPPYRRLARLVIRDEDPQRVAQRADAIADALRRPGGPVEVLGPSACPIARIAGRFRFQIELLADRPAPLQALLAEGRNRGIIKPGAGLAVDVDPTALL